MKTGLSVGIHVAEKLKSSEALRPLVADRVFSVAAVSGTQRPYINYTRTNLTPENTKDGWVKDTAVVAIEIVADSYTTAVEIAEIVRERLEGMPSNYGDWEVRDCEMLKAMDGYALELDAYLISLEFSFEIY